MPHLPHSSSGPYMSISHWKINGERNLIIVGSGGQKGELSRMYLSASIQIPNRKRHTFHLQQEVTLASRRGRFFFSLPANSSVNERPMKSDFKLPVSPNGPVVYNNPSDFPFSSIKEFPLLCFTWTCVWLTIVVCPKLLFFATPE